jgi:23S rRNA-/tRNA-specific pseudouridylate synthase
MVGENTIFSGVLGEGRLDSALAHALPQFSRARIQGLIAEDAVLIAGKATNDAASKKFAGQSFQL